MKQFTFSSEICRMPVVNMVTGRIVARSFTPYFDKETLTVSYLALSTDGSRREDLFVPFDSLGSVNDVCAMVSVPETPYIPEKGRCCRLIGEPLSAKAGMMSLFSFGSIAQTDIGENGEVISLVLSDGHTLNIPRGGSPEENTGSEALASEMLAHADDLMRISSTTREAPSRSRESSRRTAPVPENRDNSRPAAENKPQQEIRKAEHNEKDAEAPVKQPEKQDTAETDGKEPSASVRKKAAPRKLPKMKFRFRKYVAPIVAMLIFFVLYCFMQFFIIKSKGG